MRTDMKTGSRKWHTPDAIRMTVSITLVAVLVSARIPSTVQEVLPTSAIHEKCFSNDDCPLQSTCRASGCDGYNCLCDKEYVASKDRTQCLKASRIGARCDNSSRCISEFATCTDGICACVNGFVSTNDGRCKLPGTGFVGEDCGTCEYPALCVNGICKCAEKFRPLTIDEFWLDPLNMLQCRPLEYHMGKCNGTSLEIPMAMRADIETLGTPAPHIGHDHDWSLVLPETEIYGACSDHSECPSNSKCRPSSCDGFLCLCEIGFISSTDRTRCMKARRIGERCDARSDECISPFATCNITCTCMPGFVTTQDGRCKIKGNNYIGEQCSNDDECEYPGSCKDGVCACLPPQRKLIEKEFWIDPTLAIQCRQEDYSIWLCNGTDIEIPLELRDEMTAEMVQDIVREMGHNHDDHDHDDIKEGDPTILVDVEPVEKDSFLIPLNISAVLAVIGLAILIALIFRAKRKQAVQMRSSSSNVSSSKSFVPEDEWAAAPKVMRIPRPGLTYTDAYDDDVFTVSTLERERGDNPYDSQWTRQLANGHTFDTSHVVLCQSSH